MIPIEILARNFVVKNIATLFGVNLYRTIKGEIFENVSPLSNIQFQDHTFCVIISNAETIVSLNYFFRLLPNKSSPSIVALKSSIAPPCFYNTIQTS